MAGRSLVGELATRSQPALPRGAEMLIEVNTGFLLQKIPSETRIAEEIVLVTFIKHRELRS